jgi:hypothetical protein
MLRDRAISTAEKEDELVRNGSVSPDAQDDAKNMTRRVAEVPIEGAKSSGRRRNSRRSRGRSTEAVRFFVGKTGDPKPMLDQEVVSEAEGLVIAFKTDGRLFRVEEFTVAQRIERGKVSLEKQQTTAGQRISTTNAS